MAAVRNDHPDAAIAPFRGMAYRAAGAALLSAACVAAVAAGWHSPVRIVLALAFLLFVPGMAVTELLEIDDLAYRLTVVTGTSLAVDLAVALPLFYARAWSVGLALAVLIVLSAAALGTAGTLIWRRESRAGAR